MKTRWTLAAVLAAALTAVIQSSAQTPRLPPYEAVGRQGVLPAVAPVESRDALTVKAVAKAIEPPAALTVERGVVFTWLHVAGLPAGPAVIRDLETTLAGEFGVLVDRPVEQGEYSPMGAAWKAIGSLPAESAAAHLEAWRRYLRLKRLHLDRNHNRGIGE